MTVRVRGKNLEVTPALKDYVEKKVETITKQFKTVGEITAVMRIERNKHIVESRFLQAVSSSAPRKAAKTCMLPLIIVWKKSSARSINIKPVS